MYTSYTHTNTHKRERERKTETLSSMNFMITTNEKPTTDTHTQEEAIPTQHWDSHPTTRGKEQEKNYKNNQKTINNMANKYIPMNNYCSKKTQSKDTEARYIYVYVYIYAVLPGRGHGNPLQCSCLENPHGQRSLVGYSPWGRRESDTAEWLTHTHAVLFIIAHCYLYVQNVFLEH